MQLQTPVSQSGTMTLVLRTDKRYSTKGRIMNKILGICAYLSLCFILAPAMASAQDNIITLEGSHYRITCHDCDKEVAAAAVDAVEKIWKISTDLWGGADKKLKLKRDIHIYRTTAAYEEVEARLTHGKLKKNLALSHYGSQSAHIALQPECSDETLVLLSLPDLTRRLVVHEASHLAVFHLVPATFMDHPFWLSEGFATWIEKEMAKTEKGNTRPEEDPYSSKSMVRVQRLLGEVKLPAPSAVFQDQWDDMNWRDKYAVAFHLFTFLLEEKHSNKFKRFLGEVHQLEGGSDVMGRINKLLEKKMGTKAMGSLDREFQQYVRNLSPRWDEESRSLSLQDDQWIQLAFPGSDAIAWQQEEMGKAYTAEGKFTLLPQKKKQMNFLLGRSDKGFVSVAMRPGSVTVYEYTHHDNSWKKLCEEKGPAFDAGETISFRITVDDETLAVSLEGKEVCRMTLQSRTLLRGRWTFKGRTLRTSGGLQGRTLHGRWDGRWGLGAHRGSGGIWEAVQVKTK